MGRTVKPCTNCGKRKEIVSGGLCNACRMSAIVPGDSLERYNTMQKKRDAKVRSALNTLITSLQTLEENGLLTPENSVKIWFVLTAEIPVLVPLLKITFSALLERHRLPVPPAEPKGENSTAAVGGGQAKESAKCKSGIALALNKTDKTKKPN
jgi:hypothetical protein